MGRHLQQGFTLIEVILVLAITTLLMTGIMANSHRRLQDQHYREAVSSFRDFVAGAFEDTDAIKNDLQGTVDRCNGRTPDPRQSPQTWRGAAPCFFAGKELRITNGANETTNVTSSAVKAFLDHNRRVSYGERGENDENRTNFTIDWGVQARYSQARGGMPYRDHAFRIIKHPTQGFVLLQESREGGSWGRVWEDIVICLRHPQNPDPRQWSAIVIPNHAVSAAEISTRSGDGVCERVRS
ncbi:MAG: prepilin-type N-terminal cleavage/methylation domain-containing protein [Candidatus Saccharibacteria bacterium]|nr:prepilin-type N-terminal cleavage/methylation domain-containing protein [Candidatus Saccharibacteria bacterium]